MARASSRARPNTRWFIERPFADESLESVFERAYHAYKGIALAREGWLVEMCKDLGSRSGGLSSRALVRVANAIGVPPVDLHKAILPDAPHLLSPAHRRAYCRACWIEDDRADRPRYFRRAWARALTFRCATHDEPLRAAPRPMQPLGDIPLPLDRPVYGGEELEVLRLVDSFSEQLAQSLFNAVPWPRMWRLDPIRARNLVGRSVSNLRSVPSPCPAQYAWLGGGPDPVCQYRFRPVDSTRGSVWESYRQLASPASRRAAVWLAAWIVVPELAVDLRPSNLGDQVLNQDVSRIAIAEGQGAGRRMIRLRSAIAREATAWEM